MADMSNARFDGDRPASEAPPFETVMASDQCPGCNENRVDYLVWQDSPEGEYVECASCGAWYDPNEE